MFYYVVTRLFTIKLYLNTMPSVMLYEKLSNYVVAPYIMKKRVIIRKKRLAILFLGTESIIGVFYYVIIYCSMLAFKCTN